jgi:hypothetical protein
MAALLREAIASGGTMELRLAAGDGGGGGGPSKQELLKQELLYFDAYNDVGVHELMLQDEPRNRAYAAAIHNCRHLMKGKAVLDVGCGTGACVRTPVQQG